MARHDLAASLGAYHLSPASLAGLIGVEPGEVEQWLDGAAPVPAAVKAYLRVLALLDPEIRRAELRQLHRRPGRLADGCYSVQYKGLVSNGVSLLLLAGGIVHGHDTAGGRYQGTFEPIDGGASHRLDVELTIPPGVMLVTGAFAGPQGAAVRITTVIDRPTPTSRTVLDVGGRPVEIAVTYLGPMPHPATNEPPAPAA